MNNEPAETLLEAEAAAPLTAAQKHRAMDEYRRLINLIPHGKHKNQKGQKGAFGSSKTARKK